MLSLGPLVFYSPWILLGLLSLPAIYFLLRAIPPAPRRLFFPATWLTRDIASHTTTAQKTPLWLLLLRLGLLALVILVLAEPALERGDLLEGDGPVLMVIDNDWAAASDWTERVDAIGGLIEAFERQQRTVALVETAPPQGGWSTERAIPAAKASQQLLTLRPRPWTSDFNATLELTRKAKQTLEDGANARILFASSGVALGTRGPARANLSAAEFISKLNAIAPLSVLALDDADIRHVILAHVQATSDGYSVLVSRLENQPRLAITVLVEDANGTQLARTSAVFEDGEARKDADLRLAPELRARAYRIRLEGIQSAASVHYLDARSKRPLVGIVQTRSAAIEQPLQTGAYYIRRALKPFATVAQNSLKALVDDGARAIFLPGHGPLNQSDADALTPWIESGGILVRFAGPALFGAESLMDEPLLTTQLRPQPRVVGGSLSWAQRLPIAPFDQASPFHGLAVPGDVTIEQQAIARPSSAAPTVFARLEDGTPLITAKSMGLGTLVLFHTTASPAWSDLALSGTFVEMLQRLINLGGTGPAGVDNAGSTLVLSSALDARGSLRRPQGEDVDLRFSALVRSPASPEVPPGIFEDETVSYAHNLANDVGPFTPLTQMRSIRTAIGGLPLTTLKGVQNNKLEPVLYGLIMLLALLDGIASLYLRGALAGLPKRKTRSQLGGTLAKTSVIAICVLLGLSPQTEAAEAPSALAATVRLACIETGRGSTDTLCLKGLKSLSRQLNMRTSVWTGAPQMVSLNADNLGLYPVLYWPVQPEQTDLTAREAANLNAYMTGGGLILLDLGVGAEGTANMDVRMPSSRALEAIGERLVLPPLDLVPETHVLTHSFYILKTMPGRRGQGQVWLEAGGEGAAASISPVIIGSADWLSAWAQTGSSLPGYAGGENRRSELAIRFGINVVMYALTGTYKADQVHLPALLERVGRDD